MSAAVLRDAAELLRILKADSPKVVLAVQMAAATRAASGIEAQDLSRQALQALTAHLHYAADERPTRALKRWSSIRTLDQIVTELHKAANNLEREAALAGKKAPNAAQPKES